MTASAHALPAGRLALVLGLLLASPGAPAAPACEISGDARLWAYDACLWRHETDDVLHPAVAACAERNRRLIDRVGACRAKRVFKDRICTLARDWALDDPDPRTCMAVDQPLGPSVRDGGIGGGP